MDQKGEQIWCKGKGGERKEKQRTATGLGGGNRKVRGRPCPPPSVSALRSASDGGHDTLFFSSNVK